MDKIPALRLTLTTLPGISLEAMAVDLCRIATTYGLLCTTTFNGRPVFARPGGTTETVLDRLEAEG